jgi:S-adenosylhomocysteine hydrolase
MTAPRHLFPALPLLERVKAQFANRRAPLHNVGMVCLQHLVETTGSLFEELIGLGLNPDHTFILGKLYSTNPSVESRLRELGFQVLPSRAPNAWGTYETHLQVEIEEMWNNAASKFRSSSVDQIVALDDGGCVLASVPRSVRLSLPVTGVEQTMSGIALQVAGQVHIPVVQVATSAVKKLLEPFLIQQAVFQRVSQREFFRREISCGVVGLGSIGTAVLAALLERNSSVNVFDKQEDIANGGLPPGVVRCSSLEELFRKSDCIFGCSGTDLLKGADWWKSISGSKVLVSCSSHDREFQTILKSLNDDQKKQSNKLADTVVRTQGGEWLVMRGGFPANFDGSLESVAEADIQLTRALLMGGILDAAQLGTKPDGGYSSLMLSPRLQSFVVNQWLDLVPPKRDSYSPQILGIFRDTARIADYSAGEAVIPLAEHLSGSDAVEASKAPIAGA